MDPADRTPNRSHLEHHEESPSLRGIAPEDETEKASKTGSDQGNWEYRGGGKRGRVNRYSGHVTYIGGAEGERLRDALAAVSRDLLDWAATAQHTTVNPPDHYEHGEAA